MTAGPTSEPLDEVRRLTNFSTGKLGTELACFLARQGHEVILLRGAGSVYPSPISGRLEVLPFSTTEDLRMRLEQLAGDGAPVRAVFHAAAVSDFAFGTIWERQASGELREVQSRKISTRGGELLAELRPTPKVISRLREWFPEALLAGWKYGVEGGIAEIESEARRQLEENGTDLCVLNGPAHGNGFTVMGKDGFRKRVETAPELFECLNGQLKSRS